MSDLEAQNQQSQQQDGGIREVPVPQPQVHEQPSTEETKLGSSRDRMWTLYMKQAGAFDQHMVEDWKGVMEGTLIFSGLFSAVVTTFMVESLRKLTADGGSLDNSPPMNPKFLISSSAYIAINALWSLSLAFAMGCAISATLVQQWARSYLHAVDNQHQPPHKRALIRAYMYEGVGESYMTIAIEGIPILLHASLFLFLIGLIIYFYGINPLIAYPIMAVFIVSITMYLIPTCMPLVRSNFPFHTPLSTPFWWFWRTAWHKENWKSAKTMETTREYDATHIKRVERSSGAIVWILRQSDEDREFEELLDAIAGYKGKRRDKYPSGRVLIADLVKEYPVEVLLRTYAMLKLCGRFSKKPDNRVTVILRAVPALAVSWHTISWKNSKTSVDAQILFRWPLEMLETIDKAVAGNKMCLVESDLVLSTYRILLQIMIWTTGAKVVDARTLDADPPATATTTTIATTTTNSNKLDFDHDMDNIRAAKQIGKSANERPSDLIVDTLVSSDFRKALSQTFPINKESGDIITHDTSHLEPYLAMLDFLFKTGESAQQRLSQSISNLKLPPELDEKFGRIASLMDDVQKPSATRKPAEADPPSTFPPRPELHRSKSTYNIPTTAYPTGNSDKTLTDNGQFPFSSRAANVTANTGADDLNSRDDLDYRNSVSTTSATVTNGNI
ncbi:hypothetical protein BDZ94DRAFT_1240252 [Collybia nuda]|uniref:DUF6535 domain-containing protein n=1 Tax=Collybia nuda TaxID=64659 RepID=A0A9P5XWN0_9AGAR|nr:hypothetical protein BDZ94DRAFT_1240252 [Collybia nuda]